MNISVNFKKIYTFIICICLVAGNNKAIADDAMPDIKLLTFYDRNKSGMDVCGFDIVGREYRDSTIYDVSDSGKYIATWQGWGSSSNSKPPIVQIFSTDTKIEKNIVMEGFLPFGFEPNNDFFDVSIGNYSLNYVDANKLFDGTDNAVNASKSFDKYSEITNEWKAMGGKNGFIFFQHKKSVMLGVLDTKTNIFYKILLDLGEELVQIGYSPKNGEYIPFVVTRVNDHYNAWFLYSKDNVSIKRLDGDEINVIGEQDGNIFYVSRGSGFRRLMSLSNDGQKVLSKENIDLYNGELLPSGELILNDFNGEAYRYNNSLSKISKSNDISYSFLTHSKKLGELYFIQSNNEKPKIVSISDGKINNLELPCDYDASIFGYPVSFKSPKGEIFGNMFGGINAAKQNNKNKKIVLYYHGGPYANVSKWGDTDIQKFAKLGFDVLAVNYPFSPGHGDKYIDGNSANVETVYDLSINMLRALENRNNKKYDEIYLAGNSFGTLYINHGVISKKIPINGAFVSKPACDFTYSYNKNNGFSFHIIKNNISYYIGKKLNVIDANKVLTRVNSCDLKNTNVPYAIVVGKFDENTSPEDGYKMQKTSKNSKVIALDEAHNSTKESAELQIENAIEFWATKKRN